MATRKDDWAAIETALSNARIERTIALKQVAIAEAKIAAYESALDAKPKVTRRKRAA